MEIVAAVPSSLQHHACFLCCFFCFVHITVGLNDLPQCGRMIQLNRCLTFGSMASRKATVNFETFGDGFVGHSSLFGSLEVALPSLDFQGCSGVCLHHQLSAR